MLSRQGELTGKLIPRLRAVDGRERVADNSRFDSGAFVDHELAGFTSSPSLVIIAEDDESMADTLPHLEVVESDEDEDDAPPTNQTADLLEALRRRRGERESAQYDELEDAMAEHPSTGSIRIVDIPLADIPLADTPFPDFGDEPTQTAPQPGSLHHFSAKSSKRGRATMPSWDEIVFGARSDDDPA